MANQVPIFEPQGRAFREYLHSYKMVVPPGHGGGGLNAFHNRITPELLRVIEESVNNLGPIKVSYTMLVHLVMPVGDDVETMDYFFRRMEPLVINTTNHEGIKETLQRVINRMNEELANVTEFGSGWSFNGVRKVYLDVARYVR